MPTSDLFLSSNCNFSSEGDRDFVFQISDLLTALLGSYLRQEITIFGSHK